MPNGEDQEQYYKQELTQSVPRPKESIIISPHNKSGTCMEECAIHHLSTEENDAMHALNDARQRGFLLERLRNMAQSLKDMQWIGEDELNLFIDEVETMHNANNEQQQDVLDANIDCEDHADIANLAMDGNHIDLEEFKSTLSPSQQKTYDFNMQALSTGRQVHTAIIG